MARLAGLLLVVLVAVTACAAPRSERCRKLCEREARCLETTGKADDVPFDQGECEAACSALERDEQGETRIQRHESCVSAASGCADIVACMQ